MLFERERERENGSILAGILSATRQRGGKIKEESEARRERERERERERHNS